MSQPNPRIANAVALFRRGDLTGARQAAETELGTQGESDVLLHLMGIICCREGDLENGVGYLRRAAVVKPSDPAILVALMRALMDSGRAIEALDIAFDADGLSPAELLILWKTRAELPRIMPRMSGTNPKRWNEC